MLFFLVILAQVVYLFGLSVFMVFFPGSQTVWLTSTLAVFIVKYQRPLWIALITVHNLAMVAGRGWVLFLLGLVLEALLSHVHSGKL